MKRDSAWRARARGVLGRLVLTAFLLCGWLGAPGCARPPAAAPPGAAQRLGPLIQELSEPGGYFDTDNLISNESAFLSVAEHLDAAGPGGVYLGVGPDQNYSYVALVRPRWAFILDIRRQNMLQHLLFNAFLERADGPLAYLCLLLARPCPAAAVEPWELERGLAVLGAIPPSRESFEENLASALEHATGRLGVALSRGDRAAIRGIYEGFFEGQLELRFSSHGRPFRAHHPTLRALLTARSPGGRGSFLASAEDYRFVRDLARGGRLVPVVGDFAGPSALASIARFVGARGEKVRAFYVSNVEFYLMGSARFDDYVRNLRGLPRDSRTLLVRACFHYGAEHPARVAGHRSTTVVQPMERFLSLYDGGRYSSYWDVCTRDYLR
jgi:hypothetical protein